MKTFCTFYLILCLKTFLTVSMSILNSGPIVDDLLAVYENAVEMVKMFVYLINIKFTLHISFHPNF